MAGADQVFLEVFQPRGEARTAHACLESEHRMRQRAEDRDTVQRIEVVARMHVAEIDGESGAISCGVDTRLDVFVREAARVSENIYAASQSFLQQAFGVGKLMVDGVRGKLGQYVVIDGMAAELDSRKLHFRKLFPC